MALRIPRAYRDLTIFNFLSKFPSEDHCIEFLTKFGLIPRKDEFDGKECPETDCEDNTLSTLDETKQEGEGYKCRWFIRCKGRKRRAGDTRKRGCGKSWNPLQGGWFERSHIPFQKHLVLMYCYVAEVSYNLAVRENKTHHETIGHFFSYCRDLATMCVDNTEKIGGPGVRVEIDECHLYTPKYHRGHPHPSSTWVIGGKDELGRIFMEQISIRDKKTIHAILRRRVEPLSEVHTDQWGGYLNITDPFNSVTGIGCGMSAHLTVNRSVEFVSTLDLGNGAFLKITTNHIERIWKDMKTHIKSARRYVNSQNEEIDHLQGYLGSFVYFYNALKDKDSYRNRFFTFLNDVKVHYPILTYQTL